MTLSKNYSSMVAILGTVVQEFSQGTVLYWHFLPGFCIGKRDVDKQQEHQKPLLFLPRMVKLMRS